MQFLIGCCYDVPDGFFIIYEFDFIAIEIGNDCAGPLGDIDAGEDIDEGLLSGEVTVNFSLGHIPR